MQYHSYTMLYEYSDYGIYGICFFSKHLKTLDDTQFTNFTSEAQVWTCLFLFHRDVFYKPVMFTNSVDPVRSSLIRNKIACLGFSNIYQSSS